MNDGLPTARRRVAIASLALVGVAIVVSLAIGPVPQPQAYHAFADSRTRLGVPNANDVLTNVAYLVAGAWVLLATWRATRGPAPLEAWERRGMVVYGVGLLLTTVGSTLYHLDPRDATLVWDRIPITIVFAAFVSLVLGERLGPRVGARTLLPFLVAGVASVAVWGWTLSRMPGGDLRAYGVVKGLSALVPAAALLLVPGPRSSRRAIVLVLALFAVATAFEAVDEAVFRATGGVVSGHTMKHLVSAAASACILLWFRARRRLRGPPEAAIS